MVTPIDIQYVLILLQSLHQISSYLIRISQTDIRSTQEGGRPAAHIVRAFLIDLPQSGHSLWPVLLADRAQTPTVQICQLPFL
jgi:hypothetical protein